MWSSEIILYEPFSEFLIEDDGISIHISHFNKLFLQCAIKAFIGGIVFWGFYSGDVLIDGKNFASSGEMFFEFGSVVMADIEDGAIEQIIEALKEVFSIEGIFTCVHTGESHL